MMRVLASALLLLSVCALAVLLPACASPANSNSVAHSTRALADPLADLPMNEVQVIGSHNSFKLAMQPELFTMALATAPRTEHIDYSHISLTDQLNLGLRNLEIDVHYDPVGARFSDPLGNRLLKSNNIEPWPRDERSELTTPGFKVLHDVDFDFRSSRYSFEGALTELREWSAAHPDHPPIVVTMNCRAGQSRDPFAPSAAPLDEAVMRTLDEALSGTLGRERLLRPDDLRRDESSLRAGVLRHGWPTLRQASGRFLFVLDEGGKTRTEYLRAFPGLRDASFFVDVEPEQPEAAIFVMNDPRTQHDEIRKRVRQGFLVRTRADADTQEARRNDFSRFESAMSSGAQIITTDYYIPDRRRNDTYFVRFENGGFARANPVHLSPTKADDDHPTNSGSARR
jgi:hypothetical protein